VASNLTVFAHLNPTEQRVPWAGPAQVTPSANNNMERAASS